jgi:DNA mismatch endonuclease (patch repair protein)
LDKFDRNKRSWVMGRVKSKDTKPEVLVRSILHRLGFRFRKNRTDLPGRPDIVLPKHHKVILVHGCFWHGHRKCKRAIRPSSNKAFWERKLNTNMTRDRRNIRLLKQGGWHVLVIWTCQLGCITTIACRLEDFLSNSAEGVSVHGRRKKDQCSQSHSTVS